ncbi:hypothetical protein CHUV2995_03071 [Corynebacterium diphtheriae subsp. lausannense]|nr:hypothetical protein CHUV2995_03071 [Corynebacterium diphtheriae subsp. lausannense]
MVLSSSNPQVFLYTCLECGFWATRLRDGLVDCGYTVRQVALPCRLGGTPPTFGTSCHTGIPAPKAEALAQATADSTGAAIPGMAEKLGPVVGSALRLAFADSTSMVMYFSAGFLILGLISAVLLAKK